MGALNNSVYESWAIAQGRKYNRRIEVLDLATRKLRKGIMTTEDLQADPNPKYRNDRNEALRLSLDKITKAMEKKRRPLAKTSAGENIDTSNKIS